MGVISYLRGDGILSDQKALTGTPGVLETLSSRQFSPYISLGSSPNARRADRINAVYQTQQSAAYGWIYRCNPSVRRVVDYIARNVAQLGLKVYKRVSDDEREHVGDHPAAESLRNPNAQTPGQQFIFNLVADFLVYSNAYALKFRPENGDGLTLVGVSPHLVGIIGQSHFAADAYRIWRMDGSYFDVDPQSVVHWRGYNPDDPRKGESYLETLREELAADAASRSAVTELYKSGLALPGWVERPVEAPEWTEEGRKRFQEGMANQAKAGKRRAPVFEEGMVYKQGGVTPEDAELLSARRFTLEQVASLYGMKNVPPEGEDERRQFYADVLPPITEILAAFLDLQVLVAEYGADDHYFEFNMDEKLMGDDRLKALTSAAGAPPLTRNEARARLNLPAKEGGDELITPLNVTVGGKPSPQVMPVQNPNGPPQDGSHRTEDVPVPAGRSLALNGHHKTAELTVAQKAPLVPRRRLASERRNRWAGEYQGVLERYFDRQRQSLKSKRAQTKAITDDRWNNELGNGLNDVAERQFEAEGKHIAFRLASSFDPDFGQNWLAAKSIGAAEAINRTTQQHADEAGLDDAFDQAKGRVVGAAMAYATDIAAFSTKVACEQAPGEPTVTIDGGECEVCAPFQGSWAMNELEQWPAYHPACVCVADVTSAPEKAIQGDVKVINPPPPVNMAPVFHFDVQVPEGAFQFKGGDVTVEPPPPAEIYVGSPEVNVAPAMVSIEEGAMSAPNVTVQAPPPSPAPEVYIDNPVTVEAAQPAEVKIDKGAIEVNVSSPDVIVEGAQAPNVNLEVKGGKTKRTVTFSDGRTAEVEESDNKTKTIKFSDGREATINESEEDA